MSKLDDYQGTTRVAIEAAMTMLERVTRRAVQLDSNPVNGDVTFIFMGRDDSEKPIFAHVPRFDLACQPTERIVANVLQVVDHYGIFPIDATKEAMKEHYESGLELDAEVARALGWVDFWSDGKARMAYPPEEQSLGIGHDERHPIPEYSTTWEGMRLVVEHLQGLKEINGRRVRLMVKVIAIHGRYQVAIIDYLNNDVCLSEVIEDSAPHAVALAAILIQKHG
jgi:hypothetical protein